MGGSQGVFWSVFLLSLFFLIAPVFAQEFSSNANFYWNGYYRNNVHPNPAVTCEIDHIFITASTNTYVSVPTSGTFPVNSHPSYSSSSILNEYFQEELPGEIWSGPENKNISQSTLTYNDAKYFAGTGFQNAYAVEVKSGEGSEGINSVFSESGTITSVNPPPDTTVGDFKELAATIQSQATGVTIGSGTRVKEKASSQAGSPEGDNDSGVWEVKQNYVLANTIENEAYSFGSNASAWSQAVNGTKYSESFGVGADNTVQVPIYPVALFYCGNDAPIEVAANCVAPEFYKNSQGVGQSAGAYSTSSAASYHAPGNSNICTTTTTYPVQEAGPTGNIGLPIISDRQLSCKFPLGSTGADLESYFADNGITCRDRPQGGLEPTPENLDYTDEIANCGAQPNSIRVFAPAPAQPDQFPWDPSFPPSLSELANWARPVYVTFNEASNCVSGGFSETYFCEVAANPNPQNNGTNLNWTTTVYRKVGNGRQAISPTSPSYKWKGSDSVDQTTSTNTLGHSYVETGSQNMRVEVTGGNIPKINCSNGAMVDNLQVSCTGTPIKSINNSPNQIMWQAFAKGGKADVSPFYNYNWSLNPSGGSTPNSSVVDASYNNHGTKNATVTVTDMAGNSRNASCQVQIQRFDFTCQPDKLAAFTGETVTWSVTPDDPTLSYSYSWSGTNIPSAIVSPATQVSHPLPVSYQTTGTKTASVTVTLAGTPITKPCGSVEVVTGPEPTTPTCLISPQQVTLPSGQTSQIFDVQIYKFNQPITSATLNCGDAASSSQTEDSCLNLSDGDQCSFTCANYTSSGTVSLTLSNATESDECFAQVGEGAVPQCVINVNPTSVVAGPSSQATATIQFSGFSGNVDLTTVNCGTGISSPQTSCTGQSGTCSYTCTGFANNSGSNNTETISATLSQGAVVASCSTNITVSTPVNEAPTCEFLEPEGDDQEFLEDVDTVSFRVKVTDPDDVITEGRINYGDSSQEPIQITDMQNVTFDHVYSESNIPGELYTVTFTVEDEDGATGACERKLKVKPTFEPYCDLQPTSRSINFGENAQFTLLFDNFGNNVDSMQIACTGNTNPAGTSSGCPPLNTATRTTGTSCQVSCANYQADGQVSATVSIGNEIAICDASVTVQGNPGSVGELIIDIDSDKSEYNKSIPSDDLTLTIDVRKAASDITIQTVNYVVYRLAATSPADQLVTIGNYTANFSSAQTSGSIKFVRNNLPVDSSSLPIGNHTYIAKITSINGIPAPSIEPYNDDVIILIREAKKAVPEITLPLAFLVVIIVLGIISRK